MIREIRCLPSNGEDLGSDLLEPFKTRQSSTSAVRREVGTGEGLWPTAVNKRPWTPRLTQQVRVRASKLHAHAHKHAYTNKHIKPFLERTRETGFSSRAFANGPQRPEFHARYRGERQRRARKMAPAALAKQPEFDPWDLRG